MWIYPEIQKKPLAPKTHRKPLSVQYSAFLSKKGLTRSMVNNRTARSISIKAEFMGWAYNLGYTHEVIAEVMGLERSTVTHHLIKRYDRY